MISYFLKKAYMVLVLVCVSAALYAEGDYRTLAAQIGVKAKESGLRRVAVASFSSNEATKKQAEEQVQNLDKVLIRAVRYQAKRQSFTW